MARDFNGSTDRIDWASQATLTGSPITISAWIYSDGCADTNSDYILNIQTTGATFGAVFFARSDAAGEVRQLAFTRDGGTDLLRRMTAVANFAGAWHHVLVTHDGTMTDATTVHIYKDGSEVASYDLSNNGASEQAITGSWCIGGRTADDNRNFDGRIGEVAVWNRVLSAAEIAQLAAGYYPGYISTDLQFYWSGDNNSLVATPGGTGTADGTTDYTTNYPAITYPATLSGRATITATGQVNGAAHSAASILSGRATIIATGTASGGGTAHNAVATILARATVLATGRRVVNRSATIAGDANLTATPYVLIDDIILEWTEVSATIQGRATIIATGRVTKNASSTISGRATVSATGRVIKNAAGALAGRATVIATAQVGRRAQATISARATILATGSITGRVEGVATITPRATILATGQAGRRAQASLRGQATLSATGLVTVNAQAAPAGRATIIATGSVTVNAQATITGSATLSGTGTVTAGSTSHSAVASLAGYATVTASGLVGVFGQAVITATANLQGVPPTRGAGTREILYMPSRDTLYMPTREDVIIDG